MGTIAYNVIPFGVGTPPSITSFSGLVLTEGTFLTFDFAPYTNEADGDVITWAVSPIPSGMALVGSVLSGVPVVGDYVLNTSATDVDGTGVGTFSFKVIAAGGGNPPVMSTPATQFVASGNFFTFDLASITTEPDGDTVTWAVVPLPTGLTLVGSVLSGFPLVGTNNIIATATDPDGNDTVTFDVVVS